MPRLRLPPLPSPGTYSDYFPRAKLRLPPDPKNHREFPGRFVITNRKLTDDFVKALGIRPNEVVLEMFAGTGALTRSLLLGGNSEDAVEAAAGWVDAAVPKPADVAEDFPGWRDQLSNVKSTPTSSEPSLPLPRAVIAIEPSPEYLVRGLGMHRSHIPPPLGRVSFNKKEPHDALQDVRSSSIKHHQVNSPVVHRDHNVMTIVQSSIEPRLYLSPTTPYLWETLPAVLSHEIVKPSLEMVERSTTRPWNAPPPPITIVGQIPNSVVGEQLVAQWIGSPMGAAQGTPSWIWTNGRIRLALLVERNTYDRLMSKPREAARCKLGVLANALFRVSPLPPLHHVANVDKASRMSESRPLTVNPANSTVAKHILDYLKAEVKQTPRTTTYPSDFWPIRNVHNLSMVSPYMRTPYLGVLLEPRETSPIRWEQKDVWDFVLRKCFAREASPIRDAIKGLGFGAENLVPRIESTGDEYRGKPYRSGALVRDLEEEEWERIVDVFDRWAFRPEQLVLDSTPPDEQLGRSFGHQL